LEENKANENERENLRVSKR